ncbi:DUF5133 domain-containing protein [Streptomyces sp. SID14478]|nr:DUF5133 domain-containing protein [Streptomyces sp. SID14478]
MLNPTATEVRTALALFADTVIADLRHSTADSRRRRADSARTLCALTGTRDLTTALSTADGFLLKSLHLGKLK